MTRDRYDDKPPLYGMVMVFLALAIVAVTAYLHAVLARAAARATGVREIKLHAARHTRATCTSKGFRSW
jgi:hypothetical protein